MKNHATALFYLALLSVLLGSTTSAMAETIYRLLADTQGFVEENFADAGVLHQASAGSRFKIVNDTSTEFVVLFTGGISSPSSLDQVTINTPSVVEHVNYLISKQQLTEYRYELAFAFDYGMLTVPIKIQWHDLNMTTGATLGAYAGWKVSLAHIPFTFIGSAGPAAIPVTDANTDIVSTELGWSYAFGLMVEPISHYQIGVVMGADHVVGDAGQKYPYQNHLWISFAIGYFFTNH